LDSTIERAQKENINIWTIYARDAGRGGRGSFRAFNAQSNLTRLSEETGAKSYYSVSANPLISSHTLTKSRCISTTSISLTFDGGNGSGKSKGRFDRFHVATELPNTKFLTPSAVFLPARRS